MMVRIGEDFIYQRFYTVGLRWIPGIQLTPQYARLHLITIDEFVVVHLDGNCRTNFHGLNLRMVKWPIPLLWPGGTPFSIMTRYICLREKK